MTGKAISKRQLRKAVVAQFARHFDVSRLDFRRELSRCKGRARLIGLGVATILYGLGFAVAYLGWSRGTVPDEALAKWVWLLMVPTSVVGALVWLITQSRGEYALRQQVKTYVQEVEADDGRLWRYRPLLQDVALKGVDVKLTIEQSERGQLDTLDPLDYAQTVFALQDRINEATNTVWNSDTVLQLAKNLQIESEA